MFGKLLLAFFVIGAVAAQNGQVVFLGDSITDGWRGQGPLWDLYYAPHGAINTGVGGHQTTDVISRINNEGIIDNLNAKVAILLIGTNDLAWGGRGEEEVAFNVGLILNLIKNKNPNAKVILLGVLPRGDGDLALWTRIQNVNRMYSQYHNEGQGIFYFNMDNAFATDAPNGVIIDHLFTDKLHLTTAGYQVWAQTMDPLFRDLLTRP